MRTIYLNLEDDIAKITTRLKKERDNEVVLVFPKRSFIFSDSINLRLLKKQVDLLGKKISILTMDEIGQMYAKEAGFPLKFLPKARPPAGFSDIRRSATPEQVEAAPTVQRSKKVLRRQPTPVSIIPAEENPDDVTATDNFFASWNDAAVAASPASPTVGSTDGIRPAAGLRPRTLRNRNRILDKAPRAVSGTTFTSYRKAAVGFVAAALIIILALVFVILPVADITVYAKTQPVARDIEISLSTQASAADSARLVMPAVVVNQPINKKNTFTGTGKKEVGSKAQGTAYIYNLTGRDLNLKANTTTLTVGTKKYVFLEDQMYIKPTSSKDADPKTDPSVRSAMVVAVDGGGESNLPAGSRMEISNQVFGSRPQALFAKTGTEITGGNSRFISQISDEDIRNSQASLTTAAIDEVRNDLKQKNLILPDKAFTVTNPQFSADKTAGTESPTFEASLSGTISGLALNYTTLVQMIRDRISGTLSGSQRLQDVSQDKANYSVKSLDISSGTTALTVHYESVAISDIDTSDIQGRISGKSKQEASEIILSKPEIDHVDIGLSPSWQNTIPHFRQKVKITVKKN